MSADPAVVGFRGVTQPPSSPANAPKPPDATPPQYSTLLGLSPPPIAAPSAPEPEERNEPPAPGQPLSGFAVASPAPIPAPPSPTPAKPAGTWDSHFAHKHVTEHGPTHFDDLARAFALALGKQRAGAQIKKRLRTGVNLAAKLQQLEIRGDFVWPPPGAWQASTTAPAESGKVLYRIPPQQIANAACDVMHQALPTSFDDLVAETIRTLGFRRVEKKSRSHVEKVLRDLGIHQDFERQSAIPEPPAASATPQPSAAPALARPSSTVAPSATPERHSLSGLIAAQEALVAKATTRCPDTATATAMARVLRALIAASGRAGVAVLAQHTGVPAFRIPGLIAKLSDCLPNESRDVLRFDHSAKEAVLDVAALEQNLRLV